MKFAAVELPKPATKTLIYGVGGVGKTTLAQLIAKLLQKPFFQLSAINAGVKDIREAIESADKQNLFQQKGAILFIDEIHRFSKSQQDALLPAVENGWVTLVAATTENPSFSVISPLLSRSLVLTLAPLTDDDVRAQLPGGRRTGSHDIEAGLPRHRESGRARQPVEQSRKAVRV